jgi:hypothetical protein
MNWWIIDGLAVVMVVIGIILCERNCWSIAGALFIGFGIVGMLAITAICIANPILNETQITVFQNQSEYLESYTPEDAIENAALTNKKIELNAWLYNAQYMKQKFGGWSLYPDEVLDLEPID